MARHTHALELEHLKTNEARERASKGSRPDCPQVIVAVAHMGDKSKRFSAEKWIEHWENQKDQERGF